MAKGSIPKVVKQPGIVRTIVNSIATRGDKDVRLANIQAKANKKKFMAASEAATKIGAQAAAMAVENTRIREKYATQRKEAEEQTERVLASKNAEMAARYGQLNGVILGSTDIDTADDSTPKGNSSETTTTNPTRWVK